MRFRVLVVGMLVAPATLEAQPRPILQPDLTLATTVALQIERTDLPTHQYFPDNFALIAIPELRYHARELGAVFSISMPAVHEQVEPAGDTRGIGNLTVAGLVVRRRGDDVTLALGGGWTFPTATATEAAYLSSRNILDGFRYFVDGHVGHVHLDGQWRAGPAAVQAQVGLEHYLVSDWWDQTLVRASLAGILTVDQRVEVVVEGTLLSDVLDEEFNEDLDVVGGFAAGARYRTGAWSAGGHAKLHLGYDEVMSRNPVLAIGVDVTRSLSW